MAFRLSRLKLAHSEISLSFARDTNIHFHYPRSYFSSQSASTSQTPSTVFRGTSFEKRCLHLLETHLGMVLRRVGGKEDGGVDLNGWWWLPDVTRVQTGPPSPEYLKQVPIKRVRILAQCKAEKKKIGPKYVRELEGVVWRHMAMDKDRAAVVAVFLSESPFTKSSILCAMSSQVPLLLVHFPPLMKDNNCSDLAESSSESAELPGSCIFNPALGGSAGLFHGEMEIRWCWFVPNSSALLSSPLSAMSSPSQSPIAHPLIESKPSSPPSYGAPALFFRGERLRGYAPPRVKYFQ
ncbi:hypothetical protein GYMLUDRAFT_80104 [Collybiopsis luxurians FD-317 M1]|nr:hypothetical protein GYMLUDRAFT_80104 [Collybiopsis luxurians FD-317 M1]